MEIDFLVKYRCIFASYSNNVLCKCKPPEAKSITMVIWVVEFSREAHCSHLDIYISQKKGSVCSEFVRPISNEPRGQTYQFFDLKIQIYYTHFSSIFCRNCQIQCFSDTVDAISKRLKYLSHVFASNYNFNTSTLWKIDRFGL